MRVTHINSVLFHTRNLMQVRNFYLEILGLPVGPHEKDGQQVPDESETYVNFTIGDTLLCFESHEERTDQGTIILNVESLPLAREQLLSKGIQLQKDHPAFLKLEDVDGREIILEQPQR